MTWPTPQNTIEEINSAGKALVSAYDSNSNLTNDHLTKWLNAYNILNNWRAAHRFPLNTFQMNLRQSARKIDSGALVAQRVKRLVSIINKLRLLQNMKLSQMQDIGGCRAVLTSALDVAQMVKYYKSKSRINHEQISMKNYIERPKNSGYRGVHLIYRYYSNNQQTSIYNGLKIEMQLRSQLQHSWATAVETVGAFVGQALKSSIGDEAWKRFFALMSTAIAIREYIMPVPNTPTDKQELREELNRYASVLNVRYRLKTYGETMRLLTKQNEKAAHYYLLELNTVRSELKISGFGRNSGPKAQQEYQEAEKRTKENCELDVVLVSVDSLSALEKAYPNYFADTRMFVELMNQELAGHQKEIKVPDPIIRQD